MFQMHMDGQMTDYSETIQTVCTLACIRIRVHDIYIYIYIYI